MDSSEAAAGDNDLSGTGMIYYENGIRGFLNSGGWLNIDFIGRDGWISARNEHADFEMWSRHPENLFAANFPTLSVPGVRSRRQLRD